MLSRTQEEIVVRIEARKSQDIFAFEIGEYIPYLDYAHAQSYLNDGVTQQQFEGLAENKDPKVVMINYMSFAFEKVHGQRGLSAGRSLMHYTAWLWLDGDNDLWPTIDEYTQYGLPQLRKICTYLGIDPKEYGDKE
jgi:hypothetical protein